MITNKTTIVVFALQGLLFAGLVATGAFVYKSKPEGVATESPSLAKQQDSSSEEVERQRLAKLKTDVVFDSRLQRLEEQVASLVKTVESGLRARAAFSPVSPAASTPRPVESNAADVQRLRVESDLASRHEREAAATSAWGQAADTAINNAFTEANAADSFFSKHKGDLQTDCRGSVCSLNWSPEGKGYASLSEAEEADLFEQAKSELIGLAASAQDAGQVKVWLDSATNPPVIRLLVDNSGGSDSGGSNPSAYSGSGKIR